MKSSATHLAVALATALASQVAAQQTAKAGEMALQWRISPSENVRVSHVSDLEIARDGSVFVVQPEQGLVRVFDQRGQPRSVLARRADKRSLGFPIRVGWKGDSLWVWDIEQSRIILFDQLGEPSRDIVLGTIGSARLLQDGTIAMKRYDEDAVRRKSGQLSAPILRYNVDGEILDTIADVDATFSAPMRVPIGVSSVQAPQPFADGPLWSVTPAGTAVVVVDRTAAKRAGPAWFRVTRLRINGDTLFTRRYPYDARPVSPALVESHIERLLQTLVPMLDRSGGTARVDRQAIEKSISRPATVPPISALVLGSDETIWLRGVEDPLERTVLWTVLDASGRPYTTVSAPKQLEILRARTGKVWGTEKRKGDTVSVVSYTVP